MWCVAAEITASASGSKMTMSASLPGAIVPFRGKSPKSLAGAVEHSSTQRFSAMRPPTTPPS